MRSDELVNFQHQSIGLPSSRFNEWFQDRIRTRTTRFCHLISSSKSDNTTTAFWIYIRIFWCLWVFIAWCTRQDERGLILLSLWCTSRWGPTLYCWPHPRRTGALRFINSALVCLLLATSMIARHYDTDTGTNVHVYIYTIVRVYACGHIYLYIHEHRPWQTQTET